MMAPALEPLVQLDRPLKMISQQQGQWQQQHASLLMLSKLLSQPLSCRTLREQSSSTQHPFSTTLGRQHTAKWQQ
jgi:hypothetical protein